MFIVKSKYLVPKNFLAITIFPFIIVKETSNVDDKILINHETIHLKQQKELLFVLFFIWYGLEFCILFLKYRNFKIAYRNIVFEKEAYPNEKSVSYAKTRKYFGFLEYY